MRKIQIRVVPVGCRLRQLCTWLISQKWFDYAVLLFIALNCITLAMERPGIPKHSFVRTPHSHRRMATRNPIGRTDMALTLTVFVVILLKEQVDSTMVVEKAGTSLKLCEARMRSAKLGCEVRSFSIRILASHPSFA